MSSAPYAVLVVDDSALMRNLIGKIIDADPDTTVAGKAMNGRFALAKIESLRPEVIVLDLEMPEMNGIEFLTERKQRGIDIPVVVLSSIARRGAQVTMDALALGASDFILKPSGSVSTDIHTVADQLLALVKSLGAEYRRRHPEAVARPPAADRPRDAATARTEAIGTGGVGAGSSPGRAREQTPDSPVPARRPPITPGPIELVAIGVSTGGPNALRKVFAQLPGDLGCAVVVVQHMPAGFTTEFARSLDRICPLAVVEAKNNDPIEPNRVLIAPGDHHIVVRGGPRPHALLSSDPQRNGHRPSADVLFESVAAEYGNRALGVIMTGMGRDGAMELGSILQRGGLTIGQDEATSVVYGMPRVAHLLGNVELQVPLSEIADTITRLVQENRGA